ncbi:MAG: tetratricopeptide (TPR) repeat protein [Planctomycetota bacterium]|jgi:tetratricopeptide (TPR) repeat protein
MLATRTSIRRGRKGRGKLKTGIAFIMVIALFGGVLFLTWGQAIDFPFVNFDDPNVIALNPVIEGLGDGHAKSVFTEVRDFAYLPFYYASFWVDHAIGGKSPRIYHQLNLLIHLINAVLLLFLLTRQGLGKLVAALACLVFLIHPAAVESVVWASGRKDVLSGLFMLSSMLLWCKCGDAESKAKFLWIGAGLFLMAMFTKASVFVLPILLLLMARRRQARQVKPAENPKLLQLGILVFAAIAVISVVVHLVVASKSGTVVSQGHGFVAQVLVMAGALSRYFINMLAPFSLSLVYFRPSDVGLDAFAIFGFVILGLGLFAVRRYFARPTLIGLGFLWILIGLIPFNNIYPRFAGVMADRYLYISLMGLAVLCAGFLQRTQQFLNGRPTQLILSLAVVGLAFLSHDRASYWRDSEVLWTDAMAKAERSVLPYLQLGQVYEERAQDVDPNAAMPLLDEASRLFATATGVAVNQREESQALIKLASLETRRGRFENALDAFERLDKALPKELSSSEVLELDHAAVTRATALAGVARYEEALRRLQKVKSTSSANREARHNRAVVMILIANRDLKAAHSDEGRQIAVEAYNEGLLEYRKVVREWPTYEAARHDYVNAYFAASWLKDYYIDITKLSNALVDDFPESGRAYYLRARVLRDIDPGGAIRDLKSSVQLDPYREEPFLLVVQLLRNTGQNKEAKLVIDMGLNTLPDSSRLLAALCETYISFGYHHKNTQNLPYAEEAAARARTAMPTSVDAWVLTVEVAIDLAEAAGRPSEKRTLWERVNEACGKLLEVDSSNAMGKNGRARYHRVKGYAYLYTKLPKNISKEARRAQRSEIRRQAMEEFLTASQISPGAEELTEVRALIRGYAAELRRRAEDWMELDDMARASVELEKAKHFDPNSGDFHAVSARLAVATLRLDEADEFYQASLKSDPKNLRVLFELGKLRFDRRQFTKAMEPLGSFLMLTDSTEDATLLGIRKSAQALMDTCLVKADKEEKK